MNQDDVAVRTLNERLADKCPGGSSSKPEARRAVL